MDATDTNFTQRVLLKASSMNRKYFASWHSAHLALLLGLALGTSVLAQEISALEAAPTDDNTTRSGDWLETRHSEYLLYQREVNLTSQAEAQPALSIALIPNEFDLIDGNAAVQYMQALAFAEQQAPLEAMREFQRKGGREAEAAGKNWSQAEPYVWLETAPNALPLERVRKYLSYSGFQTRYLDEALKRRDCNFDRNIRAVENPMGFLLPEVQALREVSRHQSMRFRLAIAEDRPQDAIHIFAQQLALGHHLDQEEFLVSNLIGIACASIGTRDAFYLSETATAPNLYWAIAALPQPLVSMRRALAYEREFAFEQFKQFREVDEEPLPASYWQRFVAELAQGTEGWGGVDLRWPMGIEAPAGQALLIGSAYPGAKLFLIEELSMDSAAVEALPVTQVVFLAVRRLYEQVRDEAFKIQYLPSPQRVGFSPDQALEVANDKYGWINGLGELFLPSIGSALSARNRLQQQLALLQTIESIRDHMASHDGRLPEQLSDLRLPAPSDPVTLKPLEYVYQAGRAKLSGAVASGAKYELVLAPAVEGDSR